MTQEEMIKRELENNCKKHSKELLDLMEAYDLAVLADNIQEAHIKDLYNEVLRDHQFFASEGCNRLHVKAGDRIKDEECTFLMSSEDFDRYNTLCAARLCKAGITDEKGYFRTNTFTIKNYNRNVLVDFIIDNIVPKGIRSDFKHLRTHLVTQEKLIKITKDAFGIAA